MFLDFIYSGKNKKARFTIPAQISYSPKYTTCTMTHRNHNFSVKFYLQSHTRGTAGVYNIIISGGC